MRLAQVQLSKVQNRFVAQGHPWLYFSDDTRRDFRPGQLLELLADHGTKAGVAFADGEHIGARVLTNRAETVDEAFFSERIRAAFSLREVAFADAEDTTTATASAADNAATTAYRLVHGEGDFLPGLVVDRYADHAVIKFDGPGARALYPLFSSSLRAALEGLGVRHLIERSRAEPASLHFGELPEGEIEILENGMRFSVDIVRGQKTGLFLDQRDSRAFIRTVADGKRVLNLYGYTGGFSVAAGLGGAAVVKTVDIAKPAVAAADVNWRLNQLSPGAHIGVAEDVPRFLEQERAMYPLIISDPPNFAPRRDAVDAALSSYAKLHAACFRKLVKGGFYLAASCSSHVTREAFFETISEGAKKARRHVQILGNWGAPFDHPRRAGFPESDYLKVFYLRAL